MGNDTVDPWHVVGRLRRKPMITATHGRCFTLGTEIALCSDICVAASDTRFGLKEVRVGIMPAAGGTFRFVQTAGYSNAMRQPFAKSGLAQLPADARRLHANASLRVLKDQSISVQPKDHTKVTTGSMQLVPAMHLGCSKCRREGLARPASEAVDSLLCFIVRSPLGQVVSLSRS